MLITQNVSDETLVSLSEENLKIINSYIDDKRTATTFTNRRQNNILPSKELVTSELIYYWMISYQIPMECQKWHLNRLLTLIKICSIKNDTKGNKMSKRDTMANNRSLNAARRKSLNSKG